MFLFILFSVFASLCYLIWMRRKLLTKVLMLDLDIFSPSDFSVMGTNIRFKNYTQEVMR